MIVTSATLLTRYIYIAEVEKENRKRSMQPNVITVLIADDHEITRTGIRNLLEQVPDIQVLGEAQDGDEIKGLVARHRPQILLLDLIMPNLSPAELEKW